MGSKAFYKYVRWDGTDVHSGTLRWAPQGAVARRGAVIRHPSSRQMAPHARHYLSASDNPRTWSWFGQRLLQLEPLDPAGVYLNSTDGGPDEYGALAWRIVRELDPFTVLLGPQGAHVRQFVERVGEVITEDQCEELDAVLVASSRDRHIVQAVARDAKRDPSSMLAHDSLRGVANVGTWYGLRCDATRDALWALVAQDLIGTADSVTGEELSEEVFDRLTTPCRQQGLLERAFD
ncbi:hypothetical protein [Terrabacter sp. NPDC080008]|uniref:hypothetical protein n=1 Tax=Terrabacter sp. NPDC080008 TaxID=3155176 RepID=UPI00344DE358